MIPANRDLPRRESGVGSAWGVFGATDQIGTMNLLTRGTVAAAAAEVVMNKVFALNADLTEFDPPLYSRQRASHVLLAEDDHGGCDETPTLHTGFLPWYREQPASQRNAMADSKQLTAARLEHSEEMAAYLWDSRLAAVVSDNPAVEVRPPGVDAEHGLFGFLHHALLVFLGIMLGELWKLDALAAACGQDGRYTAFVTSAPLRMEHGVRSPANAVAVK